jgi:hypothetical protein
MSYENNVPTLIPFCTLQFMCSPMCPQVFNLCPWGQEYQPGGVGIYLVVEYFDRFWGLN